MPGRWSRRATLFAASAVALLTVLAAAWAIFLGPRRLGPEHSDTTTTGQGFVGDHETYCAGGFYPSGGRTVHVRSVRPTGIRPGLAVVGVWGVRGGMVACGINGDPDPVLRAHLRPVSEMAFHPHAPREEWTLVVVLRAVLPGEWISTGLDIAWSAGLQRGTTHYNYRMGIWVKGF